MLGLSVLELVLLAVVAMGVFSALGVLAFKIFENLLEPKRWEADQLERGPGVSSDEIELMGSGRGTFGDRLTAVERRLPGFKKPLEGDPLDRLLASLPDVDELPSSNAGEPPGPEVGKLPPSPLPADEEE